MRLKHNVVNAEILDNDIENCGIHDFEHDSDEKVGEGIYIGTSSDQARFTIMIDKEYSTAMIKASESNSELVY